MIRIANEKSVSKYAVIQCYIAKLRIERVLTQIIPYLKGDFYNVTNGKPIFISTADKYHKLI